MPPTPEPNAPQTLIESLTGGKGAGVTATSSSSSATNHSTAAVASAGGVGEALPRSALSGEPTLHEAHKGVAAPNHHPVHGRPALRARLVRALNYLKGDELAVCLRAFELSADAHAPQTRKSGEPYITHPVEVAEILGSWRLDYQAITAALLHDVAEDTHITLAELEVQFGESIAQLVDGVSKLESVPLESREAQQAANFQKMLVAMSRDLRVIMIKLADRLHNMTTLGAMSVSAQMRIAKETQEIYSPIALQLGLANLHYELEDLCLKTLEPERYAALAKRIARSRALRAEDVEKMRKALDARLTEFGVEAAISHREKHISSIHKKMLDKTIELADVHDLHGFRILVPDLKSCYIALGAAHSLYQPKLGRFKDYVSVPRANGYQSLHTSVVGVAAQVFELQIRTHDMHRAAEMGVAAHWLYKGMGRDLSAMQVNALRWLQSLLELKAETGSALEFLEHVKVQLYQDEVYVTTPKGTVFPLPRGATAVDFAYAVHSAVGHKAVHAKINGELRPLSAELRNGDRVDIITEPDAQPRLSWLSFVVTGRARSRIRHYLRIVQNEDSVATGELMIVQSLRALGVNPNDISPDDWARYLKGEQGKTREDICADIGLGMRHAMIVAKAVAQRLAPGVTSSFTRRPESLLVRGAEGLALRFCTNCRPIPGDPIMGQIKRGQGLLIHTHDCSLIQAKKLEVERSVEVDWDSPESRGTRLFDVDVRVVATDKRGMLASLTAAIAETEGNIVNMTVEERKTAAFATLIFTVQVRDRAHLAQLLKNLKRVEHVTKVQRAKPTLAPTAPPALPALPTSISIAPHK